MGGLGSGNWYGADSKKDVVQDYLHVDVRCWQREGVLVPGRSFTWSWQRYGQEIASISVTSRRESVEFSYTLESNGVEEDVHYSIALTRTPCNFGGSRPWFVCPGVVNGARCARRVAILYGPPGRYFLCRHCNDLSYTSRQEGKATRALRRVQIAD